MTATAVYRGFDRAWLDREYSPSSRVHSLDAYLLEWAEEASFLAPAFVRAGAAFAALGYPLAPAASLPEIVTACEQGLAWLVGQRCSPVHRIRPGLPALIVAYGDNETDEFKRQSAELAAAWQEAGNSCRSVRVRGSNHFDVIDDCGDPTTNLGRIVFELADLGSS